MNKKTKKQISISNFSLWISVCSSTGDDPALRHINQNDSYIKRRREENKMIEMLFIHK